MVLYIAYVKYYDVFNCYDISTFVRDECVCSVMYLWNVCAYVPMCRVDVFTYVSTCTMLI
jgi:hypothetical protein